VSDYVVSATNRDCIRARRVAQCLRDAIACNLDHAQRLATRIKQLHGPVPGAEDFSARELCLAAPADPLDSISVLTAVLGAETAAIDRYGRIAAVATSAGDWITQNLAARLVREKEAHRELLRGMLAELAESEPA
jgi:bacterioferritin